MPIVSTERRRTPGASSYGIADFVAELRQAREQHRDERPLLAQVRRLAARLVAAKDRWLERSMCRPDPAQGFGMHLLHDEADHALAAFVVSWLPGRGTPPHDHGTWAVVAGIDGRETNAFWRRVDDGRRRGRAELAKTAESAFGPGDVLALPAGMIHSVRNDSDAITLSLHVYGRHVNFTQRSQFDPERRTETPYKVRIAGEAVLVDRLAIRTGA